MIRKPSIIGFQSTHPVWGGTCARSPGLDPVKFQSTHPVWGGTQPIISWISVFSISIHPPRVGWDTKGGFFCVGQVVFQSTHPVWGGTRMAILENAYGVFQSTHPVWGGTMVIWDGTRYNGISIHPPRVGWDNFPA